MSLSHQTVLSLSRTLRAVYTECDISILMPSGPAVPTHDEREDTACLLS